jgi:hypothetical protein
MAMCETPRIFGRLGACGPTEGCCPMMMADVASKPEIEIKLAIIFMFLFPAR